MKEERGRKDKKNSEWLEDRLWCFFSSDLATFDLLLVNFWQNGLCVCLFVCTLLFLSTGTQIKSYLNKPILVITPPPP